MLIEENKSQSALASAAFVSGVFVELTCLYLPHRQTNPDLASMVG